MKVNIPVPPSPKSMLAMSIRGCSRAYHFVRREWDNGKPQQANVKQPSNVVYNHDKGGYERQS